VLLDSPPVMMVSDGRILAGEVDGVVLVVRGASTPRQLVNQAKLYLLQSNARVVGVALNNVDLSQAGYGGYYKAYYRTVDGDSDKDTGASA
jgi:Mrp family chromosome partitioning ATPase